MGKFYLRIDQEIQVCFINPDIAGNGQGLHYGRRHTFYFLCLFLGSSGVVFNKGIEEFVFSFKINGGVRDLC